MFLAANEVMRELLTHRLKRLRRLDPILAALWLLLVAWSNAMASGAWASLTTAPPTGVNCALVLSDGSIFTDDGSGNCNKLTPDIHGSYINGTWTRLTPMNDGRLFFSTEVL